MAITVPKQLEDIMQRVRTSRYVNKGSALGIDIGSTSIKIVELRATPRGAHLETYGMIELNAYANKGEKSPNVKFDARAIAIQDLLHEIGATSRKAGIALPLSSVFVSVMETVKRDDKQLRRIIESEARRYIPVDLDKVTLVWQKILEPGEEAHTFEHAEFTMTETPKPQRIILAAASNEVLHTYEQIARDARISVPFFEAEAFSALRAVPPEKDAPYLLIDIGTAGSKSYIADERGNALATHYLQADGGSGANNTVVKTSENALRMVQEYNAVHEKKIGTCILSGAGARIPDMAPYITHKIGLPVKIANPFSEIECPMILEDTLRDVGPLYTVACGLALRALTVA
ncbi:hypothetical protein C4568_01455 [Candidatus Parcubacteria bacterium]|nr:MAG: hypothetical protein C4568_01455 [Candidatus Parcubacteria bacterium]